MDEIGTYENYPGRLVAASLFVTLAIYAAGTLILGELGPAVAAVYLVFLLWSELRVMKMSCVDCYYFGKRCAFGRGAVAALLFRKGDPSRFACKAITWVDLIPDMLVPALPIAGGVLLMLRAPSWRLAALMAIVIGASSAGNYLVRSTIACRYCRQRELGCPAERLFQQRPGGTGG